MPYILPPRAAWRPALRGLPIDPDAGMILVGDERRRLSSQEEVVLGCLLVRELATVEVLIGALWGAWLEPPDTFLAGIRVVVYRLRQKLAGTGGAISTLIGKGYRLDRAANDNSPSHSTEGHAA